MKLRWIDSTGVSNRDLAELPTCGNVRTDSSGSTFPEWERRGGGTARKRVSLSSDGDQRKPEP